MLHPTVRMTVLKWPPRVLARYLKSEGLEKEGLILQERVRLGGELRLSRSSFEEVCGFYRCMKAGLSCGGFFLKFFLDKAAECNTFVFI